jgi:hypothetical protein
MKATAKPAGTIRRKLSSMGCIAVTPFPFAAFQGAHQALRQAENRTPQAEITAAKNRIRNP